MSGTGHFISEVNVTPFVDVMLVLLIIFMVTAPMMTQGLQVDLPQTRAVSVLPKEDESIVLTVKSDGSLYLDKYQVEMADLGGQVQQLVTNQHKQLFLRADQAVPYGTVVKVMRQFPQIKVIVEGNCDQRGTSEYNLALGERRAQAAAQYLTNLGIGSDRLSTVSYGKERPLDPGHSEAAYAKNRRDEFRATY